MSKIKIPKRTDWQIIEENSDSVILSEKDSVVIEGNKNNNYITCVIKNKEKKRDRYLKTDVDNLYKTINKIISRNTNDEPLNQILKNLKFEKIEK